MSERTTSDSTTDGLTPDEQHRVVRRRYGRIANESPSIPAVKRTLSTAGFEGVRIEADEQSAEFINEWDADRDVNEYVLSAIKPAVKPRQ
jgi:hypothetical protein